MSDHPLPTQPHHLQSTHLRVRHFQAWKIIASIAFHESEVVENGL